MLSLNQLWSAVLKLRAAVDESKEPLIEGGVFASLEYVENKLHVSFPGIDIFNGIRVSVKGTSELDVNRMLEIEIIGTIPIDESAKEFLNMYLPYCFLSLFAIKVKSCIVVSHFAQTIDGKIATTSGKSQWIGNKENLVHAHRMRALCGGILIGNNTLVNDDPSLSVRLVEGENPVKIVLGSKEYNKEKIEKVGDLIWVSGSSSINELKSCFNAEKRLKCADLLSYLYKKGIYTVYIEGGSQTTSSFLLENAIDIIQVHIAPIILGSGINSFVLPEADEIAEGKRYSKYKFHKMGDEIMFIGSKICVE